MEELNKEIGEMICDACEGTGKETPGNIQIQYQTDPVTAEIQRVYERTLCKNAEGLEK